MPEKPEILIVDDKPQNLYTLEKLLQKLDVTVFSANSGNEALGLTLERDFCLAIVDVQMPEMDGYELVDLIRSSPSTANLPVIFVSAIYSDEYHHRQGYEAGAVDFLSKPFIPEILLSKVQVFIRLYQQRIQLAHWNMALERTVEQRTQELAHLNERLSRLDQVKNDFIQIAAHELRTPLTLIMGYINMLSALRQGDDQAQNMLQGMLTGSERLLEVINSMMDMSRIDSQTLNVHREALALAQIFQCLSTALQEALSERQLSLVIDGVENLPSIQADPDLIYKLFYQLLSNAIKFTPDGGKITVHGQTAGEIEEAISRRDAETQRKYFKNKELSQVEVQVIDSGIGIAPENHDLIFEKFFQLTAARLHSSGKFKFKGGGPGLGLAVARGIVLAHGGRIWVESPGHDEQTFPGSIFHVILPIAEIEGM